MAKLLSLGQQCAGKTSLLHALRDGCRPSLTREQERTIGIDTWAWRPHDNFTAGTTVDVRCGKTEWQAATVHAVNLDGTFHVKYTSVRPFSRVWFGPREGGEAVESRGQRRRGGDAKATARSARSPRSMETGRPAR